MSLQELAPLVAVVMLSEVAVGTLCVTVLYDLRGDVHRGFTGTTAVICAVLVGLQLGMLAIAPSPGRIFGRTVDAGEYAAFAHWSIALCVALLAYALFSAVGTDVARRVVGGAAAACAVVALGFAAAALASPLAGGLAGIVVFFPAALLAGGVTAGMLLGHWYLVAPDSSFKPLRRASHLIFAAVVLQAVAIVIALASATPATRSSLVGTTYGFLFWLLVVTAGLVFTAAVNALTLHYARRRANQPATAMLYILIITVLMGSVPGQLLYFVTRVPV